MFKLTPTRALKMHSPLKNLKDSEYRRFDERLMVVHHDQTAALAAIPASLRPAGQ
jgi:hypothetical protein